MNNEGITRVWQKWRFSAPQIPKFRDGSSKFWFSEQSFVLKSPPIANLQTVSGNTHTRKRVLN
jgi:hypothetical protein